jgi:hypothetical protein
MLSQQSPSSTVNSAARQQPNSSPANSTCSRRCVRPPRAHTHAIADIESSSKKKMGRAARSSHAAWNRLHRLNAWLLAATPRPADFSKLP